MGDDDEPSRDGAGMGALINDWLTRRSQAWGEVFPALRAEGVGVLDVGCRGGLHPMFREAAALLDVVGFEPDPEECARLNQQAPATFRSFRCLPHALGALEGHALLHVCRSPGASSIYVPNRAMLDRFPDAERFDVLTTEAIAVKTLDGLLQEPENRAPAHLDFLKVDTQGSELDVLRGADQLLRNRVLVVEVEVEFVRLYEGQPLFRDVDAFLGERGFTLFKLRRQEWVRRGYAHRAESTAGQLMFGDALYMKDPLGGSGRKLLEDPRQAEALLLLAMLYGSYDFVLELLEAPELADGVSRERIRRCLMARSVRLSSLFDRLRIARSALSSGDRFRRYPRRWARGDGNFYLAG